MTIPTESEETAMLLETLEYQRHHVLEILEGLSGDEDHRTEIIV